MSEQAAIAPCIFCGQPGATHELLPVPGGLSTHRVVCQAPTCFAGGPVRATQDAAIEAWNAVVPRDGPLPFTHWTCGTAHVRAERTLQIIAGVGAFELEAMEMIAGLVDEAGYDNAARAAADDVPF